MKKLVSKMDLTDLAIFVYNSLKKYGVNSVLTGGAVVSVYTENKYQSYDLDFIAAADQEKIKLAMASIGFSKIGKDFVNPKTKFTVEFPTGPLAVGDEYLGEQDEITIRGKKLKLLSPTNSIKDRLAGYFYYNDNQNLRQAIQIFTAVGGKLSEIERWAKNEKQDAKFKYFLDGLSEKQRALVPKKIIKKNR